MSADDSIVLQSYTEQWPILAAQELERIRLWIPAFSKQRIEHIGSTSVPGLAAKPIIDLAIEVIDIEDGLVAIAPLETEGYSYWRGNPDTKHMFFVKGLPPQGTGRTHHIHIFETARFNEHVRFREILRADSQVAKDYLALKLGLSEKFKYDREAYTKAKGSFIQAVLKMNEP